MKSTFKKFIIITGICTLFTGCASLGEFFDPGYNSVSVYYKAPAEYPVPKNTTVGVVRFESDFEDSSTSSKVGNYVTDSFFHLLTNDYSFLFGNEREAVASAMTKAIVKKIDECDDLFSVSKKQLDLADYYFYGGLVDCHSSTTTTYHNEDGKKYKTYEKRATARVCCILVKTDTKEIVFNKIMGIDGTAEETDSRLKVDSAAQILNGEINWLAGKFVEAILTHKECFSINLMQLKKVKNADFTEALKLARKESYSDACAIFKRLYNEEKIYEAGYNAITMLLADGKYMEAKTLSEEVFSGNESPEALDMMEKINKILENQKKIEELGTNIAEK